MSLSLEQFVSGLGFTMQELVLNRAGQISSRQLWESVRWAAWGAGLILAAAGGVLAIVYVLRPTGILRLVYLGLLIPGFLVLSYFGGRWIRAAVERKVLVDEGNLSFHGAGRGPPTMIIGHARVLAPPHATNMLTTNARYRVFYLAYSDTFLSMEPIVPEAATKREDP